MVTVYVEGGGDRAAMKSECRRAFHSFFTKAGLNKRLPKIIASGSRKDAYDDFCIALKQKKSGEHVLLLVDSEEAVAAGSGPWKHLNERKGDKWMKPSGADNNNTHLMVQAMEAWFIADKARLSSFYGKNFKENSLPKTIKLEDIEKKVLYSSLENATKDTTKGKYSKGDHSFAILALIDPSKVKQASPHAARFLDTLDTICKPSR